MRGNVKQMVQGNEIGGRDRKKETEFRCQPLGFGAVDGGKATVAVTCRKRLQLIVYSSLSLKYDGAFIEALE